MDNQPLSNREVEILKLVGQGKSNKEIALDLFISINTVKNHLRNVFQKIDVSSRTEATLYAIEHGIIESPGDASNLTNNSISNLIEIKVNDQINVRPSWFKYWWMILLIFLLTMFWVFFISNDFSLLGSSPTTLDPQYLSSLEYRWQKYSSMPQGRSNMTVVVYDNLIYTFGGQDETGVLSECQKYSPTADMWESIKEKPTAVKNATGVLISEKIYIPGGETNDGLTDVLEIYNPRLDAWSSGASLPQSLSSFASVAFEGKLYLFGGWDGEKHVNTVYIFDPETRTWLTSQPMPIASSQLSAIVSGNKIFILYGQNTETPTGRALVFNPSRISTGESAWSVETTLPELESEFSVAGIGEFIFLFGENSLNQIELYQFQSGTKSWDLLDTSENIVIPQKFSSSTILEDYLYVLGGINANGSLSNTIYRFRVIYTTVLPLIID